VIEERKVDVFAASAILLFGAVLGGFLTYQNLDQRMDSLETQIDNSERVVMINSTGRSAELTQLFREVDRSVVSVTTVGTENAEGSGFVYSRRGYIVTNEHVIDDARRVRVTFTDGSTHDASIVGKDANTDLAVLKVERRNLDPLELGNLSQVLVGQRAVAIGNPFGLRSTMTAGIISQKGRMLPTETGFSIPNVLQTDAAINPGNSGGPLMNVEGEVVGVNTAIESRTGTFSGVGFAIPVNVVKNVVPDIIDNEGDFDYPWIGVSGFDVTPEIASAMNLSESSGFLVVEVVNGSPAEEAGLRPGNRTSEINGNEVMVGGDVIKKIEGQRMTGIGDILVYLQREPEVGETVNVTIIREGEKMTVPLTLGAREEADVQ
jgi:S1-C subfamily serine protease